MVQKSPKTKTHGVVNRVQNTLFRYQAWPSVAGMKTAPYTPWLPLSDAHTSVPSAKPPCISPKTTAKHGPPIVINDTYLDDRDAGILYKGNGRMLVTWLTLPDES